MSDLEPTGLAGGIAKKVELQLRQKDRERLAEHRAR